ncbi:MAG: hypothetical protein ACREVW_04595 [Burkholderiales bacterium]
MELKDFVAESLIQIVQGVALAQKELKGSGARVSPRMRATDKAHTIGEAEMDGGQPVSSVEFDVVVTATKGKGSKGTIGVVVGALGLGTQAQSESKSGEESRIKFKVPVLLPLQERDSRDTV